MKKNLVSLVVAALLVVVTLLQPGFTKAAFAQGFYVSGRNLKDANGNNFYPRGINNPHIWFDYDAYNVLGNIAARKANIIRVVWTRDGSASRLDQILQRCADLSMVPMVELHNGTGSDDPGELNSNAYYYTRSDVLSVLKKHQRYVLINIANEWGSGSKSYYDWRENYKSPISILRNAGIISTIVVDNPGYAQNYGAGIQYGQDLLNYDSRHNLLLSVHMYAGFNNSSNITNCISGYYNANLPLVIGEFGYNYNNGNNNLSCTVDHRLVMQTASNYGYGYIAWSTQGNDSANAWLDLMTGWSTTTWWGNEVFYNNSYSIYNTAQPASIFGSGQAIANGTYRIINRNSGKALDAYNNGTADGTNVDQWPYGGGNNQRWTVTYLGSGQYSVINVNANKALDVNASGGSGANVQLWTNYSANNQKWTITATSGGYYRLSPVHNSGIALDVNGASTADGANVQVWTWSGGNNQQWAFQAP